MIASERTMCVSDAASAEKWIKGYSARNQARAA